MRRVSAEWMETQVLWMETQWMGTQCCELIIVAARVCTGVGPSKSQSVSRSETMQTTAFYHVGGRRGGWVPSQTTRQKAQQHN